MKPFLRQQLERYAERLRELDFFLQQPEVANDLERLRALTREHAEVAEVAQHYAAYCQREADLAQAREMLADADMAELARDEIAQAEAELPQREEALQALILPRDPDDARHAFIEIRAGTGGDESALFAGDLMRMYSRFAEGRGWRVEVVSDSPGEVGGYKEVVLRVVGDGVYGQLKFESGGHRVRTIEPVEGLLHNQQDLTDASGQAVHSTRQSTTQQAFEGLEQIHQIGQSNRLKSSGGGRFGRRH